MNFDMPSKFGVQGLEGLKHVRIIMPSVDTKIGIHLTVVKKRFLNLPFDAPVESGTHINILKNTDFSRLKALLEEWGLEAAMGNFIDLDNCHSFASASTIIPTVLDKVVPGLKLSNAEALTITSGYNEARVIDGVSSTVIEVFFSNQTWSEMLEKSDDCSNYEVGILKIDESSDRNDILTMGWTYKLGVGQSPVPVMFRSHRLTRLATESTLDVQFAEPYGLHPILEIAVTSPKPDGKCQLFLKLDLPKFIFADQYQFVDLEDRSPPCRLLGLWGEKNLEAPTWQVNDAGSTAMMYLSSTDVVNQTWSIPLHFRYDVPSAEHRTYHVLPPPLLFWGCQEEILRKDAPGLNFEAFFPNDTVFYIFDSPKVPYNIPTIAPGKLAEINWITLLVVSLGFLAIAISAMRQASTLKKKKKK